MKIPKILYKYRIWTDDFHKNVIKKGELFLSPPNSFQDEFDCNVPLDLDSITDGQIVQRYFEFSRNIHPNFNLHDHILWANKCADKGLLKDKKKCREIEKYFFDKFNQKAGILSLTANFLNEKLWELYGDNHKGFCVGFDTEIMNKDFASFGSCGPVRYVNELPSISPFVEDEEANKDWIEQTYVKLKKWEHEEEFRIFKMREGLSDEERKIIIPKEYFRWLIIGAKMKDEHKKEILDAVNDSFPNLIVFQSVLGDHGLELHDYLLKQKLDQY